MGLILGKSFNRNYNLRVPFLDGFYNIGLFFNNKSPFLLFSIDADFSTSKDLKHGVKINMFKNLESSKFCETFINLHNYRSQNLDIVNQFKNIKDDYIDDINFIFNENLSLSKIQVEDNTFYEQLTLYGFTLTSFSNEFLFLVAERQSIVAKIRKKLVRSSALQIATILAINVIDEYSDEARKSAIILEKPKFSTGEVINFSKLDKELKEN